MTDPHSVTDEEKIIAAFNHLALNANKHSHDKGFWAGQHFQEHGAMKIALMHSELSEALEAMRINNYYDKDGVGEELADTIIRILDYAYEADINLGACILDKMAENSKREYKHGKEF